ncbi:MAG TPA: phospho-N-acetylmuramoyl-pentapeptide-transferase [Ruminococcaceae bacterium]|nr:phospho-N-acetylmuramoyl-pentapeptide-transferase [Oscillospiraceae bacterium]
MNTYLALILAAVVAFGVTALLGYVMIPWLHKLKFGQTILDIGPSWHKKKQGTPTMGGIMFIVGLTVALVAVFVIDKVLGGDLIGGDSLNKMQMYTKLISGLLMALSLGLVGFADDYIKVVKKRNLGLTILQKTVIQTVIILAYLFSLYLSGNTWMFIPFYGVTGDLGIFFFLLGICIIYGTTNAVNFTDGIDGLCSSVTLTSAVSFLVIAFMRNNMGAGVVSAGLVGACAGFIVWNWNPAKVFMGDTGSMFLGGLVVALAYALDCPLILLPVGIIYFIEGLSDVIQIGYFKATHGKRIFKMAPIHHHFEMSGWKEKKIVIVFSLVNIIGGAVGALLVWFGRAQ